MNLQEPMNLQELTQQNLVLGIIVGLEDTGTPLVIYPNNEDESAIAANTTIPITHNDIGRTVALLFESGDFQKPIVIGVVQNPAIDAAQVNPGEFMHSYKDGKRLTIRANEELKFICGKASITLTKDGKVTINGEYIVSQSNGPNKMQGASIHLN